jgi:hypothetical protein
MGAVGSGKTRAIKTLLPIYIDEAGMEQRGAGQQSFLMALEPGAETTLRGHLCGSTSLSVPIHWHYLPPTPPSWDVLKRWAMNANSMSTDALVKATDPSKGLYTQFQRLFALCDEFICQGCQENFMGIHTFTPDMTCVIDSLTGLTKIIQQCVIGGKHARSWPETLEIQGDIEDFLNLWFGEGQAHHILTSHVDRETEYVSGGDFVTVDTVGQKLAAKIAKIPDELILADVDEAGYYWCTQRPGYILKSRTIPNLQRTEPDFRSLLNGTNNGTNT